MSLAVGSHAATSEQPISVDTLNTGTDDVEEDNNEDISTTTPKKKKKKKPKKPKAKLTAIPVEPIAEVKQPVLCISRNKHWRYISSYHGPWLQLPLELLESLLVLNLDPANLSRDDRISQSFNSRRSLPPSTDMTIYTPRGKPLPPPIDPGVFRSVATIRRLIDEASDLAVRAASGLSASALGALRSPTQGNNPWSTAQALGMGSLGDQNSGRNTNMSSTRTHRLRVLAVQKLAAAYKTDEIAASVMVMQGASALDDIAERVLKVDPTDLDAKYVHFFHEKIPSRQLAESTTTQILDELIEAQPTRLEYFRTRGIVRCFRDEYALAARDFTYVYKESRALRKARAAHKPEGEHKNKLGKNKKKNEANGNAHRKQPTLETTPTQEESLTSPTAVHPSIGPDAPDPMEPQSIFLRAASYLQHAVFLLEEALLGIEGVGRAPSHDVLDLKMFLAERGKFGGVHTEGPYGPLGPKDGEKFLAYRKVLAEPAFRETISTLLRKCIRDHEKFMAYFDTTDNDRPNFEGNLAQQIETAFLLSESLRPGSHSPPPPLPESSGAYTTYHPLLVESHFSILLGYLLLGDIVSLLPIYQRAAALVDGLEGYPVFLPARSMAQAEFIEILERLTILWAPGTVPHSLYQNRLITLPMPAETSSHRSGDSNGSTRTTSPTTEEGGQSVLLRMTSTQEDDKAAETEQQTRAANLDCFRILLAPVAARRQTRMEKEAADILKEGKKKKSLSINIPLHGPRVEIVLMYLGAVHLPELD